MPAARGRAAELTCPHRLLRKPASHTAAGLSPDIRLISGGYQTAACSVRQIAQQVSDRKRRPQAGCECTRQLFPRGNLVSRQPACGHGPPLPGRGWAVQLRPAARERTSNVPRICYACATNTPPNVPRMCHAHGVAHLYENDMCHAEPQHVPRMCHAAAKCATDVLRCATCVLRCVP